MVVIWWMWLKRWSSNNAAHINLRKCGPLFWKYGLVGALVSVPILGTSLSFWTKMNNLPELLLRSQAPHVAANSLQLRTPQSRTKAIQLSSPALVAYCNVYGILLMVSSASACYVQCIPIIKFYVLPKKGLLQLVFKDHGFTACNTQVACVCKKTGEKTSPNQPQMCDTWWSPLA